jgi:hypothetical protein
MRSRVFYLFLVGEDVVEEGCVKRDKVKTSHQDLSVFALAIRSSS